MPDTRNAKINKTWSRPPKNSLGEIGVSATQPSRVEAGLGNTCGGVEGRPRGGRGCCSQGRGGRIYGGVEVSLALEGAPPPWDLPSLEFTKSVARSKLPSLSRPQCLHVCSLCFIIRV